MQQPNEQKIYKALCKNCHKVQLENGKLFCSSCFDQPRRCRRYGCKNMADPHRIYCDSCYFERHPRSAPQTHPKPIFHCRDCNNYVDRPGSLCDHCFSGSHRCLGILPNGEECQDYTLGGSVLCFECRKRKNPEKYKNNKHK